MVDQFGREEVEKLSYNREHQAKLRTSDYNRCLELLGESGRMEDESSVVRAGRLLVLPSKHGGEERYMRRKMHNIKVISSSIGHAGFFVPITCNPY